MCVCIYIYIYIYIYICICIYMCVCVCVYICFLPFSQSIISFPLTRNPQMLMNPSLGNHVLRNNDII